jgi:hypothetical protein
MKMMVLLLLFASVNLVFSAHAHNADPPVSGILAEVSTAFNLLSLKIGVARADLLSTPTLPTGDMELIERHRRVGPIGATGWPGRVGFTGATGLQGMFEV